jgi:adenylate cyclase
MRQALISEFPLQVGEVLSADIEGKISAESVNVQLEKILISDAFARSERLKRFLRLTAEEVLQGRGRQLNEYLIGVEVFDRQENYDPRIDPIVRVEARRLRAKLEEYYREEGRRDPILIDFPKGSYAPVFRKREIKTLTAEELWSRFRSSAQMLTIAVLPFLNLSRRKELECICYGIVDQLISALTKWEDLRVVSRTSAIRFRRQSCNVRAIGRKLNVALVLGGSVQKARKRIRVAAQLTNVDDGCHLWSETYDREMKDALTIQDEISQAILNGLKTTLAPVTVAQSLELA